MEDKELEFVSTTLPLNEEQLDKYFDNIEDYMFYIDIDNSSIKGETLLNYIYNSTMKCELSLQEYNDNLDDLLIAFMSTNKQIDIPVLEDLICAILEYNVDKECGQEEEFCKFAERFIVRHKEAVEELSDFIRSLMQYIEYLIDEKTDKFEQEYESSRALHTGNNVVMLNHSTGYWRLMLNDKFKKGKVYNYSDFHELKYDGREITYSILNSFNPFGMAYAIKEAMKLEEGNTDKNI